MAAKDITLDAHSVVWYIDEKLKDRLSSAALEAIRKAERDAVIYIPAIAIMEIIYLVEKGKVNTALENLMLYIERSSSYQIVPVDTHLLKIAIPLRGMEIHDRLILATALMTDSMLVSKDREIAAMSQAVEVIW